ncbi:MAG: uncharacterized protein JWM11_3629 [Planctomycetaceae bacterium]|nr:uncharacterized protein [Planctomycetaceae bacterium]
MRPNASDSRLNELKQLGANFEILTDGYAIYVFAPVSNRLIDRLVELKQIRIIEFGVEAIPTAEQLSRMSAMSDLRKFSLSQRSGDPGAALSFVKDLKCLEDVTCSTSDLGVQQLKLAPWIKRLDLGYAPITNKSLAVIGQLKNLNRLALNGTHISDGLEFLCDLENLNELLLDNTQLGESSLIQFLDEFKGIDNLRRLSLSKMDIGDKSMEYIGRAKSLEFLALCSTKVTAKGLQNLLRCEKLRDLFFDGIDLRSEEIDVLSQLKGLKCLYVSSSKLSPTDEKLIRIALPKCEILRLNR